MKMGGPAFAFEVKGGKLFSHALPDYFLGSSMSVDAQLELRGVASHWSEILLFS